MVWLTALTERGIYTMINDPSRAIFVNSIRRVKKYRRRVVGVRVVFLTTEGLGVNWRIYGCMEATEAESV